MNRERRPARLTLEDVTGQPTTIDRPERYSELSTFCQRCHSNTKHISERDGGEVAWFCKVCDNLHKTMVRHPKAKERPKFKRPLLTKEQMRAEIDFAMARMQSKS